MPELPEVENIRLQLEKFLVGHKVESIKVNNPKVISGDYKKLVGAKVKKVRRFGKAIVVDFDNKMSFIGHVKMTGQFIYRGKNLKSPTDNPKFGDLPGKHTHVIFNLDHDSKLYFNDYRRFGWIKVEKTSDVEKESFVKKLGPEPFVVNSSGQAQLTLELFKQILSKTRRNIKTVLMDQSVIAGVGNIYANDALWSAKINPTREANSLSDLEIDELYYSIENVLTKGLESGGASELAFVRPDGTNGSYQDIALVYGKEGERCNRDDGGVIEKFKLGGRGTYKCSICQK